MAVGKTNHNMMCYGRNASEGGMLIALQTKNDKPPVKTL